MTANPGGGDYVPPRYPWNAGLDHHVGPREHQPAPPGLVPVYMQFVVRQPFPSAIEKTEAMTRFAERAVGFLLSQGVDWRTVQFEVDRETVQPFGEVWRWKAWRQA